MKRFLLPGRFVFWPSFDLHISSYSSDRVTNVRNEMIARERVGQHLFAPLSCGTRILIKVGRSTGHLAAADAADFLLAEYHSLLLFFQRVRFVYVMPNTGANRNNTIVGTGREKTRSQ